MFATLHKEIFGLLLAACTLTSAGAAAPTIIRHNLYVEHSNSELSYKGEVLQLLLEKSKAKYGPYVMENGQQQGWGQTRAFNQLDTGNLDLVASMTNQEREGKAIAVRYCLYKGLLGVRVGMGNKDNIARFNGISTREELNQIELGQVFDWPDYNIQKDAGLKVLNLPDYKTSLQRLQMGSYALMPLGVVEVAPIAKDNGLEIISKWAIAYPTAYYIFVSKKRPELAERLVYGFEQAIKDHSFDQLFAKRIEPLVSAAGLKNRKLFYIRNPYLPLDTPLERKELWHPLVTTRLR